MRPVRLAVALLTFITLAGSWMAHARGLLNGKAPEFARRDLRGQSISLAEMRGKVVLLNFWASWCAPCQIEMPVFARWQRQYGSRGLAVIGISMDDDETPVRRIVPKLKADYPIAMGDAALGKRYGGVLGLPETFLIDRDGVIRAQFQGEADLNKIESSLEALLGAR